MIKFIAIAKDKETGKKFKIGDEVDLGAERNENAVINKIAVWVDSREFQKEVLKSKEADHEKVEITEKPKRKSKKNIETK